jgi:hypothetical protein
MTLCDKMTKTERVLREIKKNKGMRFTDIQKFVVTTNGLNWDERCGRTGKRKYRGYWCDWLLGGMHSNGGDGILHSFCRKGADGKWRVVKKICSPWRRGWTWGKK